MKIAVVGTGYWGPNLIRNFSGIDEVEGVIACDVDDARLRAMGRRFPGLETVGDLDALLVRDDVSAVAIATPVSTHFDMARRVLSAGKHCWIEKPMTANSDQARELVAIARELDLRLLVDHTFIYTGAVRKLREIVKGEKFGELLYFDSVRVNLGVFQHDVNVVWDLAPHDLSIMDFILEERPRAVSATGSCHVGNGLEDIAYLTLFFDNNLIAHFHVNWLAPVKIRKTLIGGSRSMVVYDDNETIEKIKIYDKGIEVTSPEGIYETLVKYRTGDMLSPVIDQTEALAVAGRHFVECILNGKTPITDGEAGLRIVRILEASDRSLRLGGRLVELD
jgi:predicted dehydrogenase